MDTSRNYYEAVMRDFGMYKRGRTLEQYCRDEAVDFQWLTKAQRQYGEPNEVGKKKKVFKPSRTRQDDMPDLIQLHYEEDFQAGEEAKASETIPVAESKDIPADATNTQWTVSSLTLTTPAGDAIEISSRRPAAIAELLTKLGL